MRQVMLMTFHALKVHTYSVLNHMLDSIEDQEVSAFWILLNPPPLVTTLLTDKEECMANSPPKIGKGASAAYAPSSLQEAGWQDGCGGLH